MSDLDKNIENFSFFEKSSNSRIKEVNLYNEKKKKMKSILFIVLK